MHQKIDPSRATRYNPLRRTSLSRIAVSERLANRRSWTNPSSTDIQCSSDKETKCCRDGRPFPPRYSGHKLKKALGAVSQAAKIAGASQPAPECRLIQIRHTPKPGSVIPYVAEIQRQAIGQGPLDIDGPTGDVGRLEVRVHGKNAALARRHARCRLSRTIAASCEAREQGGIGAVCFSSSR